MAAATGSIPAVSVAAVAIVTSGFLTYTDHLDSAVFSSLVTLCLGYAFGKATANGNGT